MCCAPRLLGFVLLAPVSDPEFTVVHHDPLGSMPTHVTPMVPALGAEGEVLLIPASEVEFPTWVPPTASPPWLDL